MFTQRDLEEITVYARNHLKTISVENSELFKNISKLRDTADSLIKDPLVRVTGPFIEDFEVDGNPGNDDRYKECWIRKSEL